MKKGLNIIVLGSVLLVMGGCAVPNSTSYTMFGQNITKSRDSTDFLVPNSKTISQTKLNYGEPVQQIACKSGGTVLRYPITESSTAMYGVTPVKQSQNHDGVFYYDTAGNYVSQGDQAKAACL